MKNGSSSSTLPESLFSRASRAWMTNVDNWSGLKAPESFIVSCTETIEADVVS